MKKILNIVLMFVALPSLSFSSQFAGEVELSQDADFNILLDEVITIESTGKFNVYGKLGCDGSIKINGKFVMDSPIQTQINIKDSVLGQIIIDSELTIKATDEKLILGKTI